jgi:hypothetical protein
MHLPFSFVALGRMKNCFLRAFLWIVLSFGCPSFLHAHMDQIIEVKGTALVGLPDEYSPAELEMTAFRLRIGKHEMTFSPYLTNFFEEAYDLRITASWDHGPELLPPYINLHIKPKGKDYSYKLLLNLRTLDLIEFSVVLKTSGSKTWPLPIALDDRTKKEIRESIRTFK